MSSDLPIAEDDPISALTVDFAQTAQKLFAAGSVDDTLAQLLALTKEAIEGCDHAGVVLLDGDLITTPARTDPLVVDLDTLQHTFSEGPCLDAIKHKATFYADDLASDSRWSLFGPAATSIGIRSHLAIPLFGDVPLGALNCYARYPQAFGVIDRGRGLLLAALAGLAFTVARHHEDEERKTEHLHAALGTREVIGQAQGILIERERITADQAFDILRRASQHLNVKLYAVAQALVDTGEKPEMGSRHLP